LNNEALIVKAAGLAPGDYAVCLDDGTGPLAPIGTLAVRGDDEGDDEGDDHEDREGDGGGANRRGDDDDGGDDDDDDDRPSDHGDDDRIDSEGLLRLGLDALPFGASSPLDLAGRAIAVKDGAGATVLAGTTPSPIVEEPEVHFGRCPLSRPDPAVDADAEGSLKLASGDGRVVIKVHLRHLEPGQVYEITMTNPADGATESIGMVTINDEGGGRFKLDSKKGDAIPFGAQDLAAIEGFTVDVKDAAGAVVLTGAVCPAETKEDDEPHGADEECEANLARPDPAPDADATGEVEIEGEELEVEVERLAPMTAYDVVLIEPVDGGTSATIGQVTTGERGKGELEFEAVEGTPLPFGKTKVSEFVGFGVEIRDAAGAVVLAGAIPATVCEPEEDDHKGDDDGDDDDGDGDDDDGDGHDDGEDPPGADEPCEANLARPEPAPDADATGEVEIEGEELEVEVENLAPGTAYDVVLIEPVEGGASAAIGQVTTGERGKGELEFEAVEGTPLPFGKTKVSELVGFGVEIRDAEGAVVLSGAIPEIVCEAEEEDRSHDDGEDDGHGDDGEDEEDDGHDDRGEDGGGAGLVVPDETEPLFVMIGEFDAPFLRGDSNRDSQVDLADSVSMLGYLFAGGARPYCLDANDANDDGLVNIADPVAVLNFLFLGGAKPSNPGTLIPGSDPTPDALYCEDPPEA
jgi:hypothetical protein